MRRVQLPLAVVVVVWAGLPGGARSRSTGAATEAAIAGADGSVAVLAACVSSTRRLPGQPATGRPAAVLPCRSRL